VFPVERPWLCAAPPIGRAQGSSLTSSEPECAAGPAVKITELRHTRRPLARARTLCRPIRAGARHSSATEYESGGGAGAYPLAVTRDSMWAGIKPDR
jgi:hypothetical protein